MLAYVVTNVETVSIRQHEVKDDQVEGMVRGFPHGFFAIDGSIQNVSLGAETDLQRGPQGLLVLYQ